MTTIKSLKIDRVEERVRKDTGETFPVAIIAGISFSESESSTSRFTLREISIPLNGMTMEQAKQYFPKGTQLPGYEIYRKDCDPYEWEAPDGRILSLDYSWDIRRIVEQDAPAHDAAPGKSSMERHVFAGSSKSTNNQPEPAL